MFMRLRMRRSRRMTSDKRLMRMRMGRRMGRRSGPIMGRRKQTKSKGSSVVSDNKKIKINGYMTKITEVDISIY